MANELIRAEELEAQQAGQAAHARAKQRGKKARQKQSRKVMPGHG